MGDLKIPRDGHVKSLEETGLKEYVQIQVLTKALNGVQDYLLRGKYVRGEYGADDLHNAFTAIRRALLIAKSQVLEKVFEYHLLRADPAGDDLRKSLAKIAFKRLRGDLYSESMNLHGLMSPEQVEICEEVDAYLADCVEQITGERPDD